jgi:phosphatidylglycerophosphatase A
MIRLIMLIATGLGSGYLPKAPGTWGSLLGLLLWFPLQLVPSQTYPVVLVCLFFIGVFASGAAEKILDRADPGVVVIDEVVGQLITLAGAPAHPAVLLTGFLLFRACDILKPFPAGWVDRHLHGGLGIMLDDVVAGVQALLLLRGLLWLAGRYGLL